MDENSRLNLGTNSWNSNFGALRYGSLRKNVQNGQSDEFLI